MTVSRAAGLLLVLLPLAACSLTDAVGRQFEADPTVKVQAASERSVVIGPIASVDDSTARELARAHCATHDRKTGMPRLIGLTSVHYDCLR